MKTLVFFTTVCAITYCFAQDENILDLYPLNIGNEWEYKVTVKDEWPTFPPPSPDIYYETRTVIDDTLIDGKKYFTILYQSTKEADELVFERIDSLTANIYRFSRWHAEHLLDSLKSQLNDTSKANRNPDLGNDAKCVCLNVSDSIIFGQSRSFKAFYTDYSLHQSRHTLVKEIGLANYWFNFDIGYKEYQLQSATIDGNRYELTSLREGFPDKISSFNNMMIILDDPFPNPFNSVINIPFTIGRKDNIQISVYNILGERIKDSFYRQMNPGSQKISIDFKKESSGIYLIQVSNFREVQTRRVLYIK
jgi:hypothetical protein